jgi:ferric-dicitrate binding protein FerR (iron transport regulator)
MLKERLAELLSRKMSGEATAIELQELEHWLQHNPGDQYFADILLEYWNSHPDNSSIDTAADQHFAHILEMAEESPEEMNPVIEPIQKKIITIHRLKKMAIAAAVAAIIILSARMINNNKEPAIADSKNDRQKNEVVARKGARSRMVLPDGTQVWLNSDSKLQYEGSFNDTIREVMLEGEAYFDVVKDARRPFIVHTSAIDIRVLGTAFNVKSYPQEKTIETTLIHGLVEVSNKNKPQSPKIILRPKEKLVFNKVETDLPETTNNNNPVNTLQEKKGSAIAITALPKNIADTSLTETSWIYNRLIFEGDTFRELAIKMERWFNVKISFKNEKIANYRLRGVFEDEDIDQALQALQIIAPFNYKINNNEVTINK